MNVIPQSPHINVRVREYDGETREIGDSRNGRIIAWEVETDDDLVTLHPVIWSGPGPYAFSTKTLGLVEVSAD